MSTLHEGSLCPRCGSVLWFCVCDDVPNGHLICSDSGADAGECDSDPMLAALEAIAEYGCTTYTRGNCQSEGRDRNAQDFADRWCHACIAQWAIDHRIRTDHLVNKGART